MVVGAAAGQVATRFAPEERAALAAAVVGGVLVPLNSTMLAVALPDIARALDVEPGRVAVLVTAYLVAMLVCQPIGGRIGDRFGHQLIALWALVAFGAASLLAAAAPTFAVLFVARCLQAVAGAAFMPNLSAILRLTVAETRRGKAFGVMGSGIGSGAAMGPVIGGVLVAIGNWRLLFLMNVPVVLPAVVLVARLRVRELAVGSHEPVRSLALLRVRSYLAAFITQSSTNFALYSSLLVLPLVLAAKGWTSGPTGVAVSGLTIGMLVLSPVGGRLGDRFGRRQVVVGGMAIATCGCVLMAVGIGSAAWLVAGAVVLGCGQGLSGASLQTAAVEAAPPTIAASAAGLFSTSRYVGSIASSVGVAALSVSDSSSARPMALAVVVMGLVAVAAATRIGTGTGGGGGRGHHDEGLADDPIG